MSNGCLKDVCKCDMKEVPRSDGMCSGMPILAIHLESKVAVHESEVASGTGTPAGHRKERSAMMKK